MGNVQNVQKVISSKKKKSFINLMTKTVEAIAIVDVSGKFIFVNQALIDLYQGASEFVFLHKKFLDLSAPTQPQFGIKAEQAEIRVINAILGTLNQTNDFDWVISTFKKKEICVHIWATLIDLAGDISLKFVIRPTINFLDPRIRKNSDLKLSSPQILNIDENDLSSNEINSSNSDLKQTTQPSDKPVLISIEDQDLEDTIDTQIDEIKMSVRSSEDPELELKVVNYLNRIHNLCFNWISNKNLEIQNLSEKIQVERQSFRKKYQQLESHLQRRLDGYETERDVKKNVSNENQELKEKLDNLTQIIQEQFQVTEKLYKFYRDDLSVF
ncbi:hypothetical protein M0811_05311 [Anaeramoeba ignava]|uniref:PAS domain-containing protein n=1 Tax=Anaeramoeba ignava TaxID=1746090 RepID=A0A9Q0RFE6_ANAIG|nr:hypothetical protein M0811_05311 [Anaeramoeba ignava]